jgi:uncharacterized repeat protein (TIGR01451 family)
VATSADLSITKSDGVTNVTAGDGVTYTYTITVSNGGPSDAQDVSFTDTWPAGFTRGSLPAGCANVGSGPDFTCSLGTIAAGGSATRTVTYTVPASTTTTPQVNSVTVSATTGDPSNVNNTATDSNTVTTSADLSVTKSDGVTSVTAGDGVVRTYTITVTNAGPSNAAAVSLADTWPAGFTRGTVTPSQGTCTGSPSFTCSLGTINSGANATVTVTYTVPASTTTSPQVNSVTVSATTGDPNNVNNTATDSNTVATSANLSITKSDGVTSVPAGTSTTYSITLTNSGPSSVGAGVIIKDTIPANTTPSESEADCNIASGVMTCTTSSILLPGGSVTYQLTLAIPFTYREGGNTTLSNTATIDSSPVSDPNPTNNSSTDTDTVGPASVASGSTMTDSAFQLKDDLGPWTITDFEILLNTKNVVVATNPGQFYYHQRATNSFTVATKFEFSLNWPKEFTSQTEGGQPIHAYVQLAGDPANTWRDWTPQSTGICWTYSAPADNVNPNNLPNCTGDYGKITVNNVPAGAKVWVTAHLDFALKGTTQPTSIQTPKNYGPFRSNITIKHQQSGLILGTSTSQTSLLGRGKKVTVAYGSTLNAAGDPVGGVWMKVQQGSGPSVFIQSDPVSGEYVLYDGQACGDGTSGCSVGSTWDYVNATNVSTTFTVYGNGATWSGSSQNPGSFTKFCVAQNSCTPSTGTPTSTFGVTKGSAYDKNWKFAA